MTDQENQLSPQAIKSMKDKAMESLYFFAKGVCGFDWLNLRIHKPLCDMIQDFKNNKRLLVCIPRGWLKTTICSQAYPLWRAINNPNVRCLVTQNTFSNATSKLSVIKDIVEKNELFRTLFPEVLPDSTTGSWKIESMKLKRTISAPEGTFEAAGTRTQITSRHYDVIIEDDTVAPDFNDLGEQNLAPTKEMVVQAIGYHRLMPPLLVDQSTSQILVVGTRWFEKDLISWVMAQEKNYKHYVRSCRENEKGESDEKGELTYPERFGQEVLEELAVSLGPYIFSCLYFNKPVRSSDMLFRLEWFRYYETPPQKLVCYTTVDVAGDPDITDKEPDWNAVITCGKNLSTGRIYVMDYTREKCNPGRAIEIVFDHVTRWEPVRVGFETTQYQGTLIYWVKEEMRKRNQFFQVEKIRNTTKSKAARIAGLQPVFASGTIFVRSHMLELVNELLAFPLGANDDLCDVLAMQLEMWAATRGEKELVTERHNLDPLSVKQIIEEFKDRRRQMEFHFDNLVLDMMEDSRGPLEPVFDDTVSVALW